MKTLILTILKEHLVNLLDKNRHAIGDCEFSCYD